MLKTLYLVSEFTIETLQHLSAVNGCSTPLSLAIIKCFNSSQLTSSESLPIPSKLWQSQPEYQLLADIATGPAAEKAAASVDGIIQFAIAFESSLIYIKYNGNYGDHATICVFLWM